jgi:ubiquinone/menaquinone biosynthesis C-methylase UbiE
MDIPTTLNRCAGQLSSVARELAISEAKARARFLPDPVPDTGKDDYEENDQFYALMEEWWTDTAWPEAVTLLTSLWATFQRPVRLLDVACGTATIAEMFDPAIVEYNGCDRSQRYVSAAKAGRVTCQPAEKLLFSNDEFDVTMTIGSLEHMPLPVLVKAVAECARVAKIGFHHVPVSATTDLGWVQYRQQYWINTVQWWLKLFKNSYKNLTVLQSRWRGALADGYWFIGVR